MSSVPLAVPVASAPGSPPASRDFISTAIGQAFSNWAVRVAIVWVALLMLLAVLAPLLANSYPLFLKMDGYWSSPMLHYLTWVDVTLFMLAAAAAVVFPMGFLRWRSRLGIVCAAVLCTFLLALWLVPEHKVEDFGQYRAAAEDGLIQYALMAPIPYSAGDHLYDRPGERLTEPSGRHWLGTDVNGADVACRLIYASRVALSIGLISTGIALIIGVVIGGLMGYLAGATDMVGMRLIEIFEAIPTLFLIITIVSVFGRNIYIIMIVLGLTGWTGNARFIRAEFLSLRKQDFVQAAVASGLPTRSVLFRHMLPNGMTSVLISTTFGIAGAVMTESVLSFLDVGVIDQPSWGALLNQSIGPGGEFLWWLAIFPGLAIFLTVLSYNVVGEALRDALDPRLRKL